MKFETERLNSLRECLRKSFLFLHKYDEKRFYVNDTTKSPNNSFLKALRVDVSKCLGDKNTPSVETFYSLFFKKEVDGYHKKTITSLESFCKEVDKQKEKELLDDDVASIPFFKSFWEKIKKSRLYFAYFFGFLFVFVPTIVLPIISIGMYKAIYIIKEKKKKRIRLITFSLMSLLYIVSLILVITLVPKFLTPTSNESYISPKAFDIKMLGVGFVTVHNLTKDGKGKNLGYKRNLVASIGDTIIVSVLISNITDKPIENVKVSLSPKESSNNTTHTFFGKINGYNVSEVRGYAEVSTFGNSRLKSINKTYIQYDNAKSKLYFIDTKEQFSFFSGGLSIGKLFPGSTNYTIVSSNFVVEKDE